MATTVMTATRRWKRTDASLESREGGPCQNLDFGLLVPRTVRQVISVVSSSSVCSQLSQPSQETKTVSA